MLTLFIAVLLILPTPETDRITPHILCYGRYSQITVHGKHQQFCCQTRGKLKRNVEENVHAAGAKTGHAPGAKTS